ncbi:MAG: hypothetical protein LBH00_11595 [Planctomycetaceae bacterium]|jgi:hypothetical protein|nr:hypothetical protein [Planctomycetaceae bacterium]
MFSTLSMLFVLAINAVELDANFFNVPAKGIDLKDVPAIDLDAPSSFPITLQPYLPPKLSGPLKPVTFKYPLLHTSFSSSHEYQFLTDTQTPRCVKFISHIDPQSRRTEEFYAGNFLTGQVEKMFTYPFGNPQEETMIFESFSISPDGTKMIINNQSGAVKSCIVQCKDLKPVKILHAFKDCRFAGWLNDQVAFVNVHHMVNRGLAAFRLSDQKIIWKMKPDVDLRAICPAGRRYITVQKNQFYSPRPDSDTLFLVDAEQGRVIGSFENTEDLPNLPAWSGLFEFVFSPGGIRLAVGDPNGYIRIWDVTTGKKLAEFYTRNSANLIWVNEEYLYCPPSLIHIAKQLPVWEYDEAGTDDEAGNTSLNIHRLGDTLFMTENGLNKKITTVRNLPPLPHDKAAIQKILDLPPEKQFVLRPGMKAALKIDPQFQESKKEIESYMTKMLKENGVEIAETAPVTVSVSVQIEYATTSYAKETGKKIEYADEEEREHGTRPAYSETRVRMFQINVSVERNEICVWSNPNGCHYFDPIESSPFIIPQNDKILDFDDSPAKYAANMAEKILAYTVKGKHPYKELLFKDKLPKQIPNPFVIGASVISLDGTIQTIKQPQLPKE